VQNFTTQSLHTIPLFTICRMPEHMTYQKLTLPPPVPVFYHSHTHKFQQLQILTIEWHCCFCTFLDRHIIDLLRSSIMMKHTVLHGTDTLSLRQSLWCVQLTTTIIQHSNDPYRNFHHVYHTNITYTAQFLMTETHSQD
jgi:hypothetical protein